MKKSKVSYSNNSKDTVFLSNGAEGIKEPHYYIPKDIQKAIDEKKKKPAKDPNFSMFDLSKLTEFNPALVYGFEPESSPQRLAGSECFEDALFPEAGQYQDMFNAYYYAQETILPQIKKTGLTQISPDTLLSWVKSIHRFVGQSLLQCYDEASGEYTRDMIYRWHSGAELGNHIVSYLRNTHECELPIKFALFLNSNFDIDIQYALEFINLMEKISIDDRYTIHESHLLWVNYENTNKRKELVIYKLASAYNLNQLSPDEKHTVDKITKICLPPSSIPGAMNQWAQDAANQLRACDTQDLDHVSECLATIFYSLTNIHPFSNANGRTATCLVNILLRAMGCPSIVLRHPGEKEDKKSLYQRAFSEIDSSLVPLKELIKTRILEAQQHEFANKKLNQLIVLKVTFSNLLQQTKKKYPEFDLARCQDVLYSSPEVFFALKMADRDDTSIFLFSTFIHKLNQEAEKLEQIKRKNTTLFATPRLDNNQINTVTTILNRISGQDGWKHTATQRLIFWLEIQDNNQAEDIASRLKSMDVAKITLTRRADTKVPVIKCDDLNYQQLINKASQDDKKQLANSANKANLKPQ